jgi:hypothetical protein
VDWVLRGVRLDLADHVRPLTIAAFGILLRGSGFAFRKAVLRTSSRRNFGAAFAISSVIVLQDEQVPLEPRMTSYETLRWTQLRPGFEGRLDNP